MPTIYMDPEFGSDSLDGRTVLRVTGCAISGTTVTLPATASSLGVVAGMIVLSGDMNNSGGFIPQGITVSSVSGSTATLSSAGTTSASATLMFSTAVKSFAGVGTKVTVGDTVRIKKSRDAVSLGQTAQWDLLSRTITLPTPLNYTLDNCDAFWSAGGTVAGAYYAQISNSAAPQTGATVNVWNMITATDDVAEGSNSIAMVWRTNTAGGAFTTATNGTYTVFYKDLGADPIDLSGYQQISLWARNDFGLSSGTAGSGTIKLCLCSDRNGAVVEQSFTIPNRSWGPIVFDNAAGLTSQLRSISIRIENRTGPVTPANNIYPMIRLDNIIACKQRGSTDELTHKTLIGKNTTNEHWWGIRSISGGVVHLDSFGKSSPAVVRGYYNVNGTSEAATVYKREPFAVYNFPGNPSGVVVPIGTGTGTLSVNGTADSPVIYSGGWDVTDMSAQSGYSFFDANHASQSVSITGSFTILEKIGVYRNGNTDGNTGWVNVASAAQIRDVYAGVCHNGIAVTSGSRNVSLKRVLSNGSSAYMLHLRALSYGTQVDQCAFVCSETSVGIAQETLATFAAGAGSGRESHDRLMVTNTDLSNNSSGGVSFARAPQNGSTLSFCRILDNGSGAFAVSLCRGLVKIRDCLLPTENHVGFTTNSGTKVQIHNFNRVPGDHRVYLDGLARFQSEKTTGRRTGSGIGWSLRPISDTLVTSSVPARAPIAQVFVTQGKTVTASVYMSRDSINLSAALVVRSGQLAGLTEVSSELTASSDTWQQVQVTFVAPQSGVVEFEVTAHGGSQYAVFIDDFSLTQTP